MLVQDPTSNATNNQQNLMTLLSKYDAMMSNQSFGSSATTKPLRGYSINTTRFVHCMRPRTMPMLIRVCHVNCHDCACFQ